MWTKSQKLSAGVLAIAVVAFGVDRYVLAPPDAGHSSTAASSEYAVSKTSSTSAAPNRRAVGPAVGSRDSASGSLTSSASGVTLASRLAAMGQQRRLTMASCGDAFRPAEAWLTALLPPPPPEPKPAVAPVATARPATRPVPPRIDYAALFIKRHSLTAVMKKQAGGMAIIDGKLYAAGQKLDGFKLVRVGMNEATFTGKGTTFELRMSQPPVADAR
jgi:hypothetical protein